MLLAEELLLVVTDAASGRLSVPMAQVDAGLGGANLLELTLLNKVGPSGEGGEGKPGRVVVCDPSPAGDQVPDTALAIVLAHQGKKPPSVIRPLSKNLRRTLYQRLAGRGCSAPSGAGSSACSRPADGPLKIPAAKGGYASW